MLETEISYSLNPLPEAFKKISERIPKPIGTFFEFMSEQLLKDMGKPIYETWQLALQKLNDEASLKAEDMDILHDFGQGLGLSDRDEQLKNLQLAQEQLKLSEANADTLRQKNEKMYKTLGVLVGMALVLIII